MSPPKSGATAAEPTGTGKHPARESEAVTRSWSQYTSYTRCPKSYELARLLHVPQRPGVWLPAGTAFHSTIERYLRERLEGQHA